MLGICPLYIPIYCACVERVILADSRLHVGGVRSCLGIYSRPWSAQSRLSSGSAAPHTGGMANSEDGRKSGGVTMVAQSAIIHLYVQYGSLEALGLTLHYTRQGWWKHWLLEWYWLLLPPVESWLLHWGLMGKTTLLHSRYSRRRNSSSSWGIEGQGCILASQLLSSDVEDWATNLFVPSSWDSRLSLSGASSMGNSSNCRNLPQCSQRMQELSLHSRGVAEALLHESLSEQTPGGGKAGREGGRWKEKELVRKKRWQGKEWETEPEGRLSKIRDSMKNMLKNTDEVTNATNKPYAGWVLIAGSILDQVPVWQNTEIH